MFACWRIGWSGTSEGLSNTVQHPDRLFACIYSICSIYRPLYLFYIDLFRWWSFSCRRVHDRDAEVTVRPCAILDSKKRSSQPLRNFWPLGLALPVVWREFLVWGLGFDLFCFQYASIGLSPGISIAVSSAASNGSSSCCWSGSARWLS